VPNQPDAELAVAPELIDAIEAIKLLGAGSDILFGV